MNPFPGLRPFSTDESHLFFGREEQIDALLDRLREKEFVAVVGSSGSGKSSLIHAGLLPVLYGGFSTKEGSAWRVVKMRPGDRPLHRLACALNEKEAYRPEEADDLPLLIGISEAVLARGARGLVEVVAQARRPEDENLLVFIDQFEELFRFSKHEGASLADNEAAAFVKLLIEAVRQEELPIHVLITMRSDYLGDCARFRDLPEMMNDSQYLIPRMTRSQLAQAIKGPVAVGNGTVTDRLVNRMLNDIGDKQEQLPVLQHALMRTWDRWLKENDTDQPIDLHHYEAVGGLDHALSQHANEIYDSLTEHQQFVTEILFKRLTDQGEENRWTRRPSRLSEICAVANTDEEEAKEVVNRFRASGCTFLMPSSDEVPTLTGDTLLDISHESLMRIWNRLSGWVEDEASCARRYRRLSETAELHREGRWGLLRDPELAVNEEWQKKWHTNEAWATRYPGNYPQAIKFLQQSINQKNAEIQAEQDRRKEQIEEKNAKIKLYGFFAILFFVLSAGWAFSSALAFINHRRAMKGEIQGLTDSANRLQELGAPEQALADMIKAGSHFQCQPWQQSLIPCRLKSIWNNFFWFGIKTEDSDGQESKDLRDDLVVNLAKKVYSINIRLPELPHGREEEPAFSSLSYDSKAKTLYAVDATGSNLYRWMIDHGTRKHPKLLPTLPFNLDDPRCEGLSTAAEAGRSSGPARSLSISPDGRFAVTTSLRGNARLWSLQQAKAFACPLRSEGGWLSEAAFHPRPEQRLIVLQGPTDGLVRIWTLHDEGQPARLWREREVGSREPLVSFSFHPQERATVLTTDAGGDVHVWNAVTNTLRQVPDQFHGYGSVARFTPDGSRIIVAGRPKQGSQGRRRDSTITIAFYDSETLELLLERSIKIAPQGSTRSGFVVSEIYFPDENDPSTFITSSLFDSGLRAWRLSSDAKKVNKMCVLYGDRNPGWNDIHPLEPAPNATDERADPCDTSFASITSSRALRMWRSNTQDKLAMRNSLESDLPGGEDFIEREWERDKSEFDINKLMSRGCELVGDYLTQEQQGERGDLWKRLASLRACP